MGIITKITVNFDERKILWNPKWMRTVELPPRTQVEVVEQIDCNSTYVSERIYTFEIKDKDFLRFYLSDDFKYDDFVKDIQDWISVGDFSQSIEKYKLKFTSIAYNPFPDWTIYSNLI